MEVPDGRIDVGNRDAPPERLEAAIAADGTTQKEDTMPHGQITMLRGRTTEQKRKIAERMADVLVEEAGAKRARVSPSIIEVDDDAFAEGGVLIREQHT